jgi:hypothetical protein
MVLVQQLYDLTLVAIPSIPDVTLFRRIASHWYLWRYTYGDGMVYEMVHNAPWTALSALDR